MDTIYVHDIELTLIIGNNPEEKIKKQKLFVSVSLELDTRKAAESDALDDTVNYSEIYKRICDLQENTQYNLIEAFAEHVAKICLANSKVYAVTVQIQKPEALKNVPKTGIVIRREKHSNRFAV